MTNPDDTLYTATRIASITGQAGDYLDEVRAKRAASAVLRRHNVSSIAAYKSFFIAMNVGFNRDDANLPHHARAWIEAESAANIAYVKYLDNPSGTYIRLVPYCC
jgi:hypothetical protein